MAKWQAAWQALAMVWIGTSGFQYPEWKGTFYPEDLAAKKMLGYYAERFQTTEVNYSFYRIPSVKTLSGWASETPANFRFSLKAPQQMTHIKRLRDCRDVLERFWDAARSLGERLGAILFQLPPNFKKDVGVLKDFLGGLPPEMRSAFEFRHASWFDDEVFEALRANKAALCIADSEKLSAPIVSTAEHGYFRLRDTGYTSDDIARWAKVVQQQQQLKDIYVYFKHEESGVGPKFAKQMMDILTSGAPRA